VIDLIEVPRAARDQRLDVFLSKNVPGLTLERAKALASTGRVRIKGKPANPERRLWGGESIELDRPAPEPTLAVVGPKISVLYSDAEMIVVDKPAGIVVERDGNNPSVVALLASQLTGFDVDGKEEPGVVHRLDRETTGCLILARSDRAVGFLKDAFEAKKIEKRYWVVVEGRPPDQHRIQTSYGRDPADPRRYSTRFPSPRKASLRFEVLERFAKTAWLDVTLETGRTHQIRVQLSDSGWPVLGDSTYGIPSQLIARQALHSHLMVIPRLGGAETAAAPTVSAGANTITVEAPMPPDLVKLLAGLRT
jgi:23S rRNA pseudouridine1911/1915/1917 synthase